jgi:hypothetical protein
VKRRGIETPEETNAWLMKNNIENKIPPPDQPDDMCDDYGELLKFLSKAKNAVKSENNSFLRTKIVFGHFLDRFCEEHQNEPICERTKTSLKTVLSEQFDISISHGNRL